MNTIEQKIANHQAASQRRSEGKPVWDRTIKIKDLVKSDVLRSDDEDPSEHELVEKGQAIAQRIRQATGQGGDPTIDDFDFELDEIIEGFDNLKREGPPEEYGFTMIEEFDGILDEFYDWADANRVWIK